MIPNLNAEAYAKSAVVRLVGLSDMEQVCAFLYLSIHEPNQIIFV